MGAARSRNLPGQERSLEFLLGEWRLETYTGRRACKAQVVRLAASRKGVDSEGEVQLIQQGGELTHAELADEPVFELVECDSGKACSLCKSSLCQPSRKTGPADRLAKLLKVQGLSPM